MNATTHQVVRITDLEAKVLEALHASSSGTGHDFGFSEDAIGAVGKKQLGGVLSSLQKKGLISLHSYGVDGAQHSGYQTEFHYPGTKDKHEAADAIRWLLDTRAGKHVAEAVVAIQKAQASAKAAVIEPTPAPAQLHPTLTHRIVVSSGIWGKALTTADASKEWMKHSGRTSKELKELVRKGQWAVFAVTKGTIVNEMGGFTYPSKDEKPVEITDRPHEATPLDISAKELDKKAITKAATKAATKPEQKATRVKKLNKKQLRALVPPPMDLPKPDPALNVARDIMKLSLGLPGYKALTDGEKTQVWQLVRANAGDIAFAFPKAVPTMSNGDLRASNTKVAKAELKAREKAGVVVAGGTPAAKKAPAAPKGEPSAEMLRVLAEMAQGVIGKTKVDSVMRMHLGMRKLIEKTGKDSYRITEAGQAYLPKPGVVKAARKSSKKGA